ncbi:MAG: hypothetical protein R2795_15585 [Saprospiraceae bacterium]
MNNLGVPSACGLLCKPNAPQAEVRLSMANGADEVSLIGTGGLTAATIPILHPIGFVIVLPLLTSSPLYG